MGGGEIRCKKGVDVGLIVSVLPQMQETGLCRYFMGA